MRLPDMYHWTPQVNREAVRVEGLRPYQKNVTATTNDPELNVDWQHGFGCICLGPTAAQAWMYSGDMQHLEDMAWDLWQVQLDDKDEIRVRAEFGPKIQEVRVFNPIPAERLWWVGERP